MAIFDINSIIFTVLLFVIFGIFLFFDLFKRIDKSAIILIDNKTRDISNVIYRYKNAREDNGLWFNKDVVDRVIQDGKAVMITDTDIEDEDGLMDTLKILKIGSVMCVPLISNSQIRGAIYIESINKANGFRKEDLRLIHTLSDPIALNIDNGIRHKIKRRCKGDLFVSGVY